MSPMNHTSRCNSPLWSYMAHGLLHYLIVAVCELFEVYVKSNKQKKIQYQCPVYVFASKAWNLLTAYMERGHSPSVQFSILECTIPRQFRAVHAIQAIARLSTCTVTSMKGITGRVSIDYKSTQAIRLYTEPGGPEIWKGGRRSISTPNMGLSCVHIHDNIFEREEINQVHRKSCPLILISTELNRVHFLIEDWIKFIFIWRAE